MEALIQHTCAFISALFVCMLLLNIHGLTWAEDGSNGLQTTVGVRPHAVSEDARDGKEHFVPSFDVASCTIRTGPGEDDIINLKPLGRRDGYPR